MTGAFLAQKAGLSTVVVEKTALLGGTSAYSGGACWLPGSQVQQRAGIARLDRGRARLPRRDPRGPGPDEGRGVPAALPRAGRRARGRPAIAFEWLPFAEYYDAPGRVPMGRSIQPANIKRGDLPPEVADAGPAAGRARPGRRGRPQHAQRRPGPDRPAARRLSSRAGGTILHRPARSPGWSSTTATASSGSPR